MRCGRTAGLRCAFAARATPLEDELPGRLFQVAPTTDPPNGDVGVATAAGVLTVPTSFPGIRGRVAAAATLSTAAPPPLGDARPAARDCGVLGAGPAGFAVVGAVVVTGGVEEGVAFGGSRTDRVVREAGPQPMERTARASACSAAVGGGWRAAAMRAASLVCRCFMTSLVSWKRRKFESGKMSRWFCRNSTMFGARRAIALRGRGAETGGELGTDAA